jgi:hypothetical protein
MELQENPSVLHQIGGVETGKENGCDDSEGFVHFIHEKKFIQGKSLFVEDRHIEKAKGSRAAQIRYCSKSGEIGCQTGIEQKWNVTKTREGIASWSRILENARTMDMQTFTNTHLKEWITRLQVIERVTVKAQGKRATKWNGELRNKNI